MEKHCGSYINLIPDGLPELTNDISREVLRHQPIDIYTFIGDYLDVLLLKRENARIASRLVQYIIQISETIVELLNGIGLTREEADRCAAIIQKAFRGYLERTRPQIVRDEDEIIAEILDEMQIDQNVANKAANIIQKAFRKFKERKLSETRLFTGIIDWRIAAKTAIDLYRQTGVTPEEAHRAATLIKAAYKGYYTRRLMGRMGKEFEEIGSGDMLTSKIACRFRYR